MRPPAAGEIFEERFTVEAVLGQGAFAMVMLARDTGADRHVALKLLLPDAGHAYSTTMRARYQREVQIIAGLRDPHTVRLFNYGEARNGLLYMVFEHVPGRDLSELRAQGPMPPELAIHILRQILFSLREAHHAGMIHRDLKPDNVRIFAYQGDPYAVKVLDFGIARSTDAGHPSLTMAGEIIGTPRYMSPEQLRGAPLSAASDIYSLGIMMHELLGANRGSAIEPIIQRMIAPAVDDRYTTAAAVLAALDHVTAPSGHVNAPSGHVTAPSGHAPSYGHTPIPATPSPAKPSIHARVLVALIALVVCALVAIAMLLPSPADDPVVPTPPATKRDTPTLVRTSPDPVVPTARDVTVDAGPADAAIDIATGAVLSPGCGQQPVPRPGLRLLGGTLTYVPENYDHRVPHRVLILIHGDYQSANELIVESGFADIADREGIVLLAPEDQGTLLPGAQTWRDEHHGVKRVLAALRNAGEDLCLDTEQTYMLGHAAGGPIVARLSCTDLLAGAAFSGFAVATDDVKMRDCDHAVPTIWLHPKRSSHISIDASPNCMGRHQQSPAQTVARWRERNRCKNHPRTTFDDSTGRCQRFDCDAPFEMCMLEGGTLWPARREFIGHAAFGCSGDMGVDFPVAEHVWEFFGSLKLATPADER